MDGSILFGEVFRFTEDGVQNEYIYLATDGEVTYAAKILSPEWTKKIKDRDDFVSKRHDAVKFKSNAAYCYVILKTAEYQDRMAHLGKPGYDSSSIIFDKTGCTLNDEDKRQIKNEILDPDSPVTGGLKDIIRGLDIK